MLGLLTPKLYFYSSLAEAYELVKLTNRSDLWSDLYRDHISFFRKADRYFGLGVTNNAQGLKLFYQMLKNGKLKRYKKNCFANFEF